MRTKVDPSTAMEALIHRGNTRLVDQHLIQMYARWRERMGVAKLPATRFIDKQWLPISSRHVGSRKNSM